MGLQKALDDEERTDPEIGQAAAKYEQRVDSILKKDTRERDDIARIDALALLSELIASTELHDDERHAFESMVGQLRPPNTRLSVKQLEWVKARHNELFIKYENLVSSGRAPRGKEVDTPLVLRTLPKSPPRRCPFCKSYNCEKGDCL